MKKICFICIELIKYEFLMKKTLIVFSLILLAAFMQAQVEFLQFNTFDELLQKAKVEKKLIFIQIETNECNQCNHVAMIGLSGSQLLEKYQVNFISTKIKQTDLIYITLIKNLRIDKAVGSIYLNAEGEFLMNQNMTTSNTMSYLDWADKAKFYAGKLSYVNNLKNEYEKGNRAPIFLEKYILGLREIHRYDAQLMDEYIGKLVVDSLKSDKVIKFVSEQGQPLTSIAYRMVRTVNSPKKIDSIWYLLDNDIRVQSNNRTRTKTFEEAVKTKNTNLVYQLSNFIGNIYGKDWRRGQYQATQATLDYYKAIKDTTDYISNAKNFANYQLMMVSNDSLKALNVREQEQANATRAREKRIVSVSDEYAGALNNIAWSFYLMATDSVMLNMALKWTHRAIDIREKVSTTPDPETSAFLDTYAHLLLFTSTALVCQMIASSSR